MDKIIVLEWLKQVFKSKEKGLEARVIDLTTKQISNY
jgi:hypothetical protein